MLDTYVRPLVASPLQNITASVSKSGLSANQLTIIGFVLGMVACLLVAMEHYFAGLLFVLLNRVFDGLDGAVARLSAPTDFGRYLDTVLNTVFHSAFVFFFALGASEYDNNGAALFLILAYIAIVASALAYDSIAATRPAVEAPSVFHPASLVGGTETLIFMILCCLLPQLFSAFALLFAILCWVTVGGRFLLATKNFRG